MKKKLLSLVLAFSIFSTTPITATYATPSITRQQAVDKYYQYQSSYNAKEVPIVNSFREQYDGSLAHQVVERAIWYMENGYSVYDHTDYRTTGTWDCSGFTQAVYRDFGFNFSRASRYYDTYGTPVPGVKAVVTGTNTSGQKKYALQGVENLRPGDILTFWYPDTTGSGTHIGHVGIYMGLINGKPSFINTTSNRPTSVGIDNNFTYWYGERFAGARRVLPADAWDPAAASKYKDSGPVIPTTYYLQPQKPVVMPTPPKPVTTAPAPVQDTSTPAGYAASLINTPKTGYAQLAVKVFEKFGITVPNTVAEQMSKYQTVAKADLEAGDLLYFWFAKSGTPEVVGVYLGNNEFVYSSEDKGTIAKANLTWSWWNTRYMSARNVPLTAEPTPAPAEPAPAPAPAEPVPATPSTVTTTEVVDYAKTLISTAKTGYAQLAVKVFEKFGITVPNTVAEQMSKYQTVAKADLKAGDLLYFWFAKSGTPEVVGIYLGNNEFIYSSEDKGTIAKANLTWSWWSARYMSARNVPLTTEPAPAPVEPVPTQPVPVPAEPTPAPTPTAPSTVTTTDIVNYANTLINTTKTGYAQLAVKVFGKFGITVPSTVATQMSKYQTVAKTSLQPGDLLYFWFSKSGTAEVVGVYLGNNEFIYSSEDKGTIAKANLTWSWWNQRYMSARRVPLSGTTTSTTTPQVTGTEIGAYAKSLYGTPKTGYAEFIVKVYSKFGIKVPTTIATQVSSLQTVSRSNLKPGDLLYFWSWTTGKPQIAAVYVGNNEFVFSSNDKGTIDKASLTWTWWSQRFVTAKRVSF